MSRDDRAEKRAKIAVISGWFGLRVSLAVSRFRNVESCFVGTCQVFLSVPFSSSL